MEPAPIFLEVQVVHLNILQILSSQMEQLRKHLTSNIKHCKLIIIPVHHLNQINCSHACSIQEADRVVITGGHSASTVSVYDESGWKEDLPDLKQGRIGHACTSFVTGGKQV